LAASILLLAKAHFYDPDLSYDSCLQDVIHTDAFLSFPHPSSIPLGVQVAHESPGGSSLSVASHRCRGT
jgi:hypothetical protein